MLKSYPQFKRNEVEKYYNKLSKSEKEIIIKYLDYRRARGLSTEGNIKDIKRYLMHIRYILEGNLNTINLDNLRGLLSIINQSRLTEGTKSNIKIHLKNFLKYLFKDWSMRFNGLEDIKISNSKNEEKINAKNMFSIEDIEKCMKAETKMYWKAFLMIQYEGALRTKETRYLKWKDIKFNIDNDISEVHIYATKTKKSRTIFIEKSTFYLKQLKQEQKNTDKESVYCFPSTKDINVPVDKSAVSKWFRRLTEKTLGSKRWNYLLRHSRATELYRLAEQGKISKDTAVRFMGHSEDMSKTYTHLDKQEIKDMLKEQIYKFEEIPEERKHELEEQNEKLRKDLMKLNERVTNLEKKRFEEYKKIKSKIAK